MKVLFAIAIFLLTFFNTVYYTRQCVYKSIIEGKDKIIESQRQYIELLKGENNVEK